ncbi:hypothetical protein BH24GEM2_BH24GEM2_00650 [soil metagenome]
MSERVIQAANLVGIESALTTLQRQTVQIGGMVEAVGGVVEQVRLDQNNLTFALQDLSTRFNAFVQDKKRVDQLQFAKTDIINVRQELETTYGFYAESRRRATGILAAVDSNTVTTEVIQQVTQADMLATAKYWLPPALGALGAWVSDDEAAAQRALAVALSRDDYKTSLFFALVSRRANRRRSAQIWLQRFFAHQDPRALDREFVVLLDAAANGIFGPEARDETSVRLKGWMTELAESAEFVPQQEARWRQIMISLAPTSSESEYGSLRRFASGQWNALSQTLAIARLHEQVREYFRNVFEGEITLSPSIAREIDNLLGSLVTNFDDEELPLRSKERRLQLIIDHDGKVDEADRVFAAEQKSFDEKVSFADLLTNAAIYPEQTKASRSTQRYAVALCRDWIVSAHDDITVKSRAAQPRDIALTIDEWTGTTRDGSNEQALLAEQAKTYDLREAEAIASIKMPPSAWAAGIFGLVIFLYGLLQFFGVFSMLVGAGAVVYAVLEYRKLNVQREMTQQKFANARKQSAQLLRATLAELVDYRAEVAREDSKAESVRATLLDISPEQYALSHETNSRTLVA